jgi:hypothetical protein
MCKHRQTLNERFYEYIGNGLSLNIVVVVAKPSGYPIFDRDGGPVRIFIRLGSR